MPMQKGEGELHKKRILQTVKRVLSPGEWKWGLCSGAREGPRRVFSCEEGAREYAGSIRADYSKIMGAVSRQTHKPCEGLSELETKERESRKYGEVHAENRRLLEMVHSWMDDEYVGARVYNALSNCPPILLTVPKTPVRKLEGACDFRTNCISVRFLGEDGGKVEERIAEIANELHYYASWLGKGDKVRWRGGNGKPIFRKMDEEAAETLSEGLAEMLTLQLIRKHGVEGSGLSRMNSVFLMLHIQEIAGEENLRKAYFCGDYSRVRERVDAALGEDAFEEVLERLSGGTRSWEAILALRRMCRETGFSVNGFYERPLQKEIINAVGSWACLPFEISGGRKGM